MAFMRVLSFLLCCSFLLFPSALGAQGVVEGFELKKLAVMYAAQADSYGAHCQKESDMAQGFIVRFREEKVLTKAEDDVLVGVSSDNKSETSGILNAARADCKDIEFMLKRLEIMRKLKDVSYLLNGVAPEDIPQDNIPALNDFMPPKTEL